MKALATLFDQHQPQASRHEFEFQEVCTDLERDFGRAVWSLPHKANVTEFKLREAGRIARERGIKKFAYLVGVLKRL